MAATTPKKITDHQKELAEKQIVEVSKKIDFYLTEYSIELLANKMKSGEFTVPGYQREDTWEDERKSKFLESLLMGLPIPFLFFWENPESGALEIVDGSQRLRTIKQFFFDGFRLGALSELPNLKGFSFEDLPDSRQKKFKNRSIRGIVLNEHADAAARFDLFERINTGSKIANPSEVRRGALSGPFMDLVIELSNDPLFVKLTPMSPKQIKEREREELVVRFFAYGDGTDEYRDNVSPFLFDYAEKMNSSFEKKAQLVAAYRKRFETTMKFVQETFPYGFAKIKNGKASPRARFEAIAIGSYLALKENSALAKKQVKVEKWFDKAKFKEVIGADGANVKKKLIERISYVKDNLLKG